MCCCVEITPVGIDLVVSCGCLPITLLCVELSICVLVLLWSLALNAILVLLGRGEKTTNNKKHLKLKLNVSLIKHPIPGRYD